MTTYILIWAMSIWDCPWYAKAEGVKPLLCKQGTTAGYHATDDPKKLEQKLQELGPLVPVKVLVIEDGRLREAKPRWTPQL